MKIIVLQYGPAIHWKIRPTDPVLYDLPAYPGVRFISPVLYLAMENLRPGKPVHQLERMLGWFEGAQLIQSNEIAFAVDDPAKYRLQDEDLAVRLVSRATRFQEVSCWFLNGLRYVSKQTAIPISPDDLYTWDWIEVDDLPLLTPIVTIKGELAMAASITDTAVSSEQIKRGCSYEATFRAPVFDGLCLDALKAHTDHDYRRSILYAAITSETALRTVLDEHYEVHIASQTDRVRVITLAQHGGALAKRDPIWERLIERDDFGCLLHEAPLYLLGRSLLLDNEGLFREAKMLYSTRNKIVHRGEPPEAVEAKYLTIDLEGSSRALVCTLEILRWLGVQETYPLPRPDFIGLSSTPIIGENP